MANQLTSSGIYLGNGTLNRVVCIGSDSEFIITKINTSQSVSGSGTAHAAGTVTLPSVSVGATGYQVYNNSSPATYDSRTTNLFVNLPASGRYLYQVTSPFTSTGSSGNVINELQFPSPPSASGTLSFSDVGRIVYSSSVGTSAGTRVLTLTNGTQQVGFGICRTRQTGAVFYARIS